MRTPTSPQRGVTLLELMSVLGIIAILLAIAFPTVSKTRALGRASSCQSNLRQMGLAAAAYAAQNKDRYPAAILYDMTAAGVVTRAWDFEQHPDGTVRPGALWGFVNGPDDVQQCPDYLGPSTFGSDPFTGYNYNTTFIGAEGRFPELDASGAWNDGWRVARRGLASGQFRATTTTALFGEGGWKGGANKFMRAPGNSVENDLWTIYAGAQAFRHQECTHVCYLDGHIDGVCTSCEGAHATASLLDSVLGFPANGFLDDGDRPYDPR